MHDHVGWIPVALSSSIEMGTSAGTRIFGEERVVWRDDKGNVHVWEDRCPHRGMRMSFGFVRGDHIACLYHGWRYDRTGQCSHIPAHPDLDVPKTIKVPTFEAEEAGGIIWCKPTDEDGNSPLPLLPEKVASVRSVYVDASLAGSSEALLASHPPGFEGTRPEALSPVCLSWRSEGRELLAALQPLNDKQSALHLVATGSLQPETLKQLVHWATGLRLVIETSMIEAA
ncbi:Rieske (2Fe-2S) protein [Peteryoungia desertarenae]|uniref:Rieske (2Fe-2S) protein n=1 Tax=Peteryoungia desertarenae TaxID=1813451 RepID=A0ABX6QJC7_9HYPH|nr:Rieske (2Fe-2S) protein [Peteryoungia desertarenae]QLF68387.1 Rieske (2Fe-2S) protein [Peteryoungia desertarenae]